MMAVAFHEPKKLPRFDAEWRRRASAPVDELTRDEIERRADDLWARHESARNRLVS